jgi:hypothetical protein
MTTATHNGHDTTSERVLFVAFELSEKNWKLGFTTGPGQKPRERGVTARHQARVLRSGHCPIVLWKHPECFDLYRVMRRSEKYF